MAYILPTQPRIRDLVVTRGGQTQTSFRLKAGDTFPSSGITSQIVVTGRDSTLYGIYPGTMHSSRNRIDWNLDPGGADAMDSIPDGANVEMFITDSFGTHKVQYGRAVRVGATYPLNPTDSETLAARAFVDDFQADTVHPHWIRKRGRTKIWSKGSLPKGISSADTFLGITLDDGISVVQYFAPLNTDTPEVTYSTVTNGEGRCIVSCLSDQSCSNWIGVLHNTVPSTDTVSIVTGTGTWSYATQASVNSNTSDNDYWRMRWIPNTKTFQVFKNGSGTPLLTWTDTLDVVADGAGYRYLNLGFDTGITQPGPYVTGWRAADVA